MSKCAKTCSNLQTRVLSLKKYKIMATILASRFKFYMDMYRTETKKKVTAKECHLLHFFVCLCFCMYGKWFSVFMERCYRSTEFSNRLISVWKERVSNFHSLNRTCTVCLCVCCLESGLRTSVCTCVDCHVKVRQH